MVKGLKETTVVVEKARIADPDPGSSQVLRVH